jgi:hypothetical protein
MSDAPALHVFCREAGPARRPLHRVAEQDDARVSCAVYDACERQPAVSAPGRLRERHVNGACAIVVVSVLAAASGVARSAPDGTCHVRTEPFEAIRVAGAASAPAQSHVGVRRKTAELFEVDLSVAAPDQAACAVSGVARLRGEPGAEVLGIVIRPDPARSTGRSGTLCQVFVQLSATGVELRTTPASCKAQALCEGRVDLDGQRFENGSKLPAGAGSPCFAGRGPDTAAGPLPARAGSERATAR